jgi:hypothetical protein
MQTEMRVRLESLAEAEASLIEPMECLSVSKLLKGIQFTAYSTRMGRIVVQYPCSQNLDG